MQIHSSCYPLLVDLLRLLPGIRPVHERHQLGVAKHRASLSSSGTADVDGVPVTLAQLEELFSCGETGRPRVSPQGASFLLYLFAEGAFDAFDCRKVEGGLELLTQYSKGLATVIDYGFWRRGRRQTESDLAPKARFQKGSGHPQLFSIPSHPHKPDATVHRLL